MHGLQGERTLMRIHIGEADRWADRPLYEAIVELLREEHFAGATVFRGILGFGATAKELHRSSPFRLSSDLPIIVECVETEERIQTILPRLDDMLGGGLITLEKVRVIMYRADLPAVERTGSWPIALGP
jgi:PII-like signaling protein